MLKQKSGNVAAVAAELFMSKSFVSRIKKRYEALPAPEPKAEIDAEEMLEALLPPNVKDVRELRDLTIADLQKRLTVGLMSDKEAVKLLNVLLRYETSLRSVANPASAQLTQYNQKTEINVLVNELKEMTPDALRALSGAPQPLVIEGVTT